ncbi:MAG: hypothetical protein O3A00_19405 [Planctomycetota bacterium]|nr:hypothetical protein [Planctomycetota bacterium]
MRNLIWLASFPKSGNTWTRLFIAAYLSGAEQLDLHRASRYSRSESLLALFAEMAGIPATDLTEEDIDAHRLAVQERLAQNIGQCVVKTHNARLTRDHRRLIFSRYTRAGIYLVRKQVATVIENHGDAMRIAGYEIPNLGSTTGSDRGAHTEEGNSMS